MLLIICNCFWIQDRNASDQEDDDVHVESLEDVEKIVDEMQKPHKTDFNSVINNLRIKPSGKSRISIPICRLVSLAVVRPVLEVDVQFLENEFINGYREGDRILYVSVYDKKKSNQFELNAEVEATWNAHWHATDASFEEKFNADDNYVSLRNKMFFVWEGNHRVTAWQRHIERFHAEDSE